MSTIDGVSSRVDSGVDQMGQSEVTFLGGPPRNFPIVLANLDSSTLDDLGEDLLRFLAAVGAQESLIFTVLAKMEGVTTFP
jgi:hypothetical protein